MPSRKGIPNKVGRQVKEMVAKALEMVGGEKYLAAQAKKNPKAFLMLVGKLMPLQMAGHDGGPLNLQVVSYEQLAAAVHEATQPEVEATDYSEGNTLQ